MFRRFSMNAIGVNSATSAASATASMQTRTQVIDARSVFFQNPNMPAALKASDVAKMLAGKTPLLATESTTEGCSGGKLPLHHHAGFNGIRHQHQQQAPPAPSAVSQRRSPPHSTRHMAAQANKRKVEQLVARLGRSSSSSSSVSSLLKVELETTGNSRSNLSTSALHYAAVLGHAETTTALLKDGADASAAGKHQRTALHLAAQGNHPAVATMLIEVGKAPLDALDSDGNTAFQLAADRGHTQIMDLLLRHGANSAASRGCYCF